MKPVPVFEAFAGYSFISIKMIHNQRTYNLVIEDFINYIHSDGGSYEKYALYVAIRMSYVNSQIFNPTPWKVKTTCGCGINRAARLLGEIKNDKTNHFHFTKKGGLVALSNKGKQERINRYGKTYRGDFVFKIKAGEYSLNDIIKILKQVYIAYYIDCATSKRNKEGVGKTTSCDEKGEPKPMYQHLMRKDSKMSRSEFNRHTLKLAKDGVILKSKRQFCRVLNHANDEIVANYKCATKVFVPKGNPLGFVTLPCTYLFNECAKDDYKHIIWHGRKINRKAGRKASRAKVNAISKTISEIDKVARWFAMNDH